MFWYHIHACSFCPQILSPSHLFCFSLDRLRERRIARILITDDCCFPFQLGLKKQKSTGKVKLDEVYSSGRYFIGPDYTFKTFAADAHYEELNKIVTFSSDKVEVEITCAMQYFLRPEDLKDMHQEYDLYYRLGQLISQICIAFTKEQIEIALTSKFVAIATSREVKRTLFLTF